MSSQEWPPSEILPVRPPLLRPWPSAETLPLEPLQQPANVKQAGEISTWLLQNFKTKELTGTVAMTTRHVPAGFQATTTCIGSRTATATISSGH